MVGFPLLTFITERLKTTWPRDKPDFPQSAAFMKTPHAPAPLRMLRAQPPPVCCEHKFFPRAIEDSVDHYSTV